MSRVQFVPALSHPTHLHAQRVVVEVRPDCQVPVRASCHVQLVLQPLPVEDLDEGLRVGPVVLQPLLDLAVGGRADRLHAQPLAVAVEELHHELEGGMEAVVEGGRSLLAAGAAVHLVAQLGQGVLPHLGQSYRFL